MVIRLPALAVVLGVVRESRTLDKGMLILVVSLLRVEFGQVGQHLVRCGERIRGVLL